MAYDGFWLFDVFDPFVAFGDVCFGLFTFVLLLANSSRMVCGRSGSKRMPCCKSCLAASAPARVENVTKPTGCIAKARDKKKMEWKTVKPIPIHRTKVQDPGTCHQRPGNAYRRCFPILAGDLQQWAFVSLQQQHTNSLARCPGSHSLAHKGTMTLHKQQQQLNCPTEPNPTRMNEWMNERGTCSKLIRLINLI